MSTIQGQDLQVLHTILIKSNMIKLLPPGFFPDHNIAAVKIMKGYFAFSVANGLCISISFPKIYRA